VSLPALDDLRLNWARNRRRAKRAARAERAFFAALLELGPGDVALDCGANVGFYARHMARSGATVHAFEPDPLAFEALSRALGDAPNVTLHPAAVGTVPGRATLSRPADFAADPVGRTVASTLMGGDGEGVEVEVIDLPAFLAALPAPPALLKLDVEGAEVELLETLEARGLLAPIRHVFCETHERQFPALRPRTFALIRALGPEGAGRVDFDWG